MIKSMAQTFNKQNCSSAERITVEVGGYSGGGVHAPGQQEGGLLPRREHEVDGSHPAQPADVGATGTFRGN